MKHICICVNVFWCVLVSVALLSIYDSFGVWIVWTGYGWLGFMSAQTLTSPLICQQHIPVELLWHLSTLQYSKSHQHKDTRSYREDWLPVCGILALLSQTRLPSQPVSRIAELLAWAALVLWRPRFRAGPGPGSGCDTYPQDMVTRTASLHGHQWSVGFAWGTTVHSILTSWCHEQLMLYGSLNKGHFYEPVLETQ